MQSGGSYVRETLATVHERTLVRLVSCMGSAMDRQSTALDEGLVAWFVITGIRTLVGMYAIVSLKVGFSIEALRK